jgi:protein involved in polysaccharide export with SLBB domain
VPFFDQPIQAKCRTEKDLRTDVTRLLSKYLKNPQISVRVTQRKSRR